MSLRNISNFFNIIKKGRLKSQLADTDMIPVGTRDAVLTDLYIKIQQLVLKILKHN